jgi:hypothetical protein
LAEDPTESRVRFGAEISEYLDRLPKIFNKSDSWAFRAKNFQAFELGLDWTRFVKEEITGIGNRALGTIRNTSMARSMS